MNRSRILKYFLVGIISFTVLFSVFFFGFQLLTRTGIFRIPGVVTFDDSLTDEEYAFLSSIFNEDVDLEKDVKISARSEFLSPVLKVGEFLYNIYVPVTDFYSTETTVSINSPDDIFDDYDGSFDVISVDDLDYTKKLLKLNDNYYLDTFKSGAVFRIITFESDIYHKEIEPLVADILKRDFPSKEKVLTLAQTGVTALSRGMNQKLYQVGDATYFADQIKEFLSSFDLTHTSNESSFTDYANSKNICSDKRFIDTLTAIGLDIVELTGNHNLDCGADAARETIDIYNENDILTVGGGKTAEEAAIPLEIDLKSNNVTMLAFNESTGGATTGDYPGANQYDEDLASRQIAEAKERGDLVIVDIQYYECNAYASEYEDPTCDRADSAAGDQVGFFRSLIDMGADIVVGTSAHQPQTFELYGDGVIFYGLGNLFFDQVWWPGTTRSLVLVHHVFNNKLLQTQIVPTVYDSGMQTRLLDEVTAEWFLNRLISVRP